VVVAEGDRLEGVCVEAVRELLDRLRLAVGAQQAGVPPL